MFDMALVVRKSGFEVFFYPAAINAHWLHLTKYITYSIEDVILNLITHLS